MCNIDIKNINEENIPIINNDKHNKLDIVFLNIAKEISSLSHCVSHQVGCVIVKDGRILVNGYNGTPPKFINCDSVFIAPLSKEEREKHHNWSNVHEIHAEQNSISFAAKHGISINGATIYITLEPCVNCLKLLISSGIKRIVYSKEYDKVEQFQREMRKELLNQSNISFNFIKLKG